VLPVRIRVAMDEMAAAAAERKLGNEIQIVIVLI
jgi:hypothetical protein